MPVKNNTIRLLPLVGAGILAAAGTTAADPQPQAASLTEAITQGSIYGQLRPRYEYVDEQSLSKDANAFTLRTRLGYRSANLNGFEGTLEFEDVRSLGSEKFNSTTNGETRYPLVPDPESTEVNQAILAYTGLADTRLQLGRQYISLENERWVGPVGWRQNSVTMDAFSLTNRSLNGLEVFYAYVDNVNRLFGEEHPTLDDWDMDSHITHLSYSGLPHLNLVGYGYFLEFEDQASQALSTRTLGIRLSGGYPLNESLKLLYTAEYAEQDDYADGRPRDAEYYWLSAGVEVSGVTVKLSQEQLSGNGTYSLTTPLATVHAHNGWADQFLASALSANGLPDGLVDTRVHISGKLAGLKLVARYHDYSSDNDDYDYGTEWNLLAVKPVNRQLKLVAKYADYSADDNAANNARNPVQSTDTRKFWVMADFSF